ncbi:MAG: hypothetical protein ABFR90_04835 [Planctomycetota bacterium]
MMIRRKWFYFAAALWVSMAAVAQTVSIIPRPSTLTEQPGQFVINTKTQITIAPANE